MTDRLQNEPINNSALGSTILAYNSSPENSQIVYEEKILKGSYFDKPLICFCLVNFLLNAAVSIITPFFPPIADEAGLSMTQISYIFAIQPLGSFFFSFVIGSRMNLWGRKKCMIIGLIFQFLAITSFGFLDELQDNKDLLLGLSLGIRFIQGVSRGAYSAISFAYIPILWPNSIQQKISILESLTGLGLMSGPFLGAALYHYVGYKWVFIIMGLMFSLVLLPTFFIFPDDVVLKGRSQTFDGSTVYKNKNIILLALVVMMTSAGTTFINPMFSIHMETYQKSGEQSSLMLGSMSIVYVLFINFIPALCRRFDKILILTVGILFSALGDMIMAPVYFLPNEWWVVLIALPIIGVANSMCVLPAIPQFMEYINRKFPNPEYKLQVSDMSSGLFVGSYSLGILVGPIIGGQVYALFLEDESDASRQIAFKWASTVIALIQITLAMTFFTFAGGVQALMRKKKSKVIVEPLLTPVEVHYDDKQSINSDQIYDDNDKSTQRNEKLSSYD